MSGAVLGACGGASDARSVPGAGGTEADGQQGNECYMATGRRGAASLRA